MQLTTSRRSFLVSSLGSAMLLKAGSQDAVNTIKTPYGGLQPQAAVDSRGVLHVVYLYGDPAAADVGYVRKSPGARVFTAPVRVNDRPGSAIAIGTVRGVHLALGKSDRVHVAWNGSSKAEPKKPGNSSAMLYTRFDKARNAFEPQRNLMTTTTGLDGGGTVAADPLGNVYVTWHGQKQQSGKPVEGEDHRRVYLARSTDGGGSFAAEVPVSPANLGACGCCGMGALADGKGNLYLLFRTAREVVHRDIYLLTSQDRGKTFQAMDLSPWELGACPMSTASLAFNNDRVLLSWETKKQVYFAEVDILNQRVGKPIAVPGEGSERKHPSVTANKRGDVLLAWTENTGWKRGGALAWQVFDRTGQPLSAKGVMAGVIPAWGLPAAVRSNNGFTIIC
jgi:hypothetical protein